MALSINVGLSRKAAKDYRSARVSINLTAELDQSLLQRPEQLQEQIRDLYAQAQQAIDGQAQALAERPATPPPQGSPPAATGPNGSGQAYKPMSASQQRALLAIARRLGVNPDLQAHSLIGVRLENLTRPQASKLIDYLRGLAPIDSSGNGNGH